MIKKLIIEYEKHKCEYIFHGHTHRRRDEVVHGTRIINPGALGGMSREHYSFCIVDLGLEDVEFIRLPG